MSPKTRARRSIGALLTANRRASTEFTSHIGCTRRRSSTPRLPHNLAIWPARAVDWCAAGRGGAGLTYVNGARGPGQHNATSRQRV